MPRPVNNRKVQVPPRTKGFIPMGYYTKESTPIRLFIEEYESIRLLDYENLSQEEAAKMMEVSRPTLTRIYERARKKIARALTESHQIIIEGGKPIYEGNWNKCAKCDSIFNIPDSVKFLECPLCRNNEIEKVNTQNK